jgi:hypothetical protein
MEESLLQGNILSRVWNNWGKQLKASIIFAERRVDILTTQQVENGEYIGKGAHEEADFSRFYAPTLSCYCCDSYAPVECIRY